MKVNKKSLSFISFVISVVSIVIVALFEPRAIASVSGAIVGLYIAFQGKRAFVKGKIIEKGDVLR